MAAILMVMLAFVLFVCGLSVLSGVISTIMHKGWKKFDGHMDDHYDYYSA